MSSIVLQVGVLDGPLVGAGVGDDDGSEVGAVVVGLAEGEGVKQNLQVKGQRVRSWSAQGSSSSLQ